MSKFDQVKTLPVYLRAPVLEALDTITAPLSVAPSVKVKRKRGKNSHVPSMPKLRRYLTSQSCRRDE